MDFFFGIFDIVIALAWTVVLIQHIKSDRQLHRTPMTIAYLLIIIVFSAFAIYELTNWRMPEL